MKAMCLLVCVALLAGCGGKKKGPATVKVSGTILFNGKPLEGAEVNFVAGDFASFGKTNSEGKFTLAQGAVPGNNKVYIRKPLTGPGFSDNPEDGMDAAQFEAAAEGNPELARKLKQSAGPVIPPEYSDPQKTKLTFNVPDEGTDSADFNIQP